MDKELFIKAFMETFENGSKEPNFSPEKHAEQLYEQIKDGWVARVEIDGILLVETESVDVDTLKEQGYKVIAYKKGSTPPFWLKK